MVDTGAEGEDRSQIGQPGEHPGRRAPDQRIFNVLDRARIGPDPDVELGHPPDKFGLPPLRRVDLRLKQKRHSMDIVWSE